MDIDCDFVGGGMKRPADDGGMDNGGPPKRFCNGEGPTIELRVLIQSKVCVETMHHCLLIIHKLMPYPCVIITNHLQNCSCL